MLHLLVDSANLKKRHLHGKKPFDFLENNGIISTFALLSKTESDMVAVVQLVRASDCGSECRRFESDQPPQSLAIARLFCFLQKRRFF